MENATKALTMAASVLIAIMVIALIYLLVNKLSEVSKQDEMQLKAEQTAEFNKEFESYEKPLMRGTEVITVINKAINNNQRYIDEQNNQIHVEVTLISDIEATDEADKKINILAGTYTENSEEYDLIVNNLETVKILKRKYFKCTQIKYNEDGKVNYMSFKELNVNESAKDSTE